MPGDWWFGEGIEGSSDQVRTLFGLLSAVPPVSVDRLGRIPGPTLEALSLPLAWGRPQGGQDSGGFATQSWVGGFRGERARV